MVINMHKPVSPQIGLQLFTPGVKWLIVPVFYFGLLVGEKILPITQFRQL
jgi:hypothetical protein